MPHEPQTTMPQEPQTVTVELPEPHGLPEDGAEDVPEGEVELSSEEERPTKRKKHRGPTKTEQFEKKLIIISWEILMVQGQLNCHHMLVLWLGNTFQFTLTPGRMLDKI